MPDINIPGVSDKYKTNDLVKSLIEVEKIPLKREQTKLDSYKSEREYWQRINQNMNSLRETTRTLYSFDNPFNEKIASSSNEYSITATPTRDASIESFKIDVDKIATADRFLSTEIDKSSTVPQGKYTYSVGDKTVSLNWKGGKVSDFVTSLNKRSNGIIKATVVGVSNTKQTLLLEALKTGSENRLVFKDDALTYSLETDMIRKTKSELTNLYQPFKLAPETNETIAIPEQVRADTSQKIEFTLKNNIVQDVTQTDSQKFNAPVLPSASSISFQGITIKNDNSQTTLPPAPVVKPRTPVVDSSVVFIRYSDGTEKLLGKLGEPGTTQAFSFSISEHPNATSIYVQNKNTGKELEVSAVQSFNENASLGYEPINPVTVAGDAKLKYEGITITRPVNTIDDIVPNVTLNLEAPTEKAATISIKPNEEAAKNAIIAFVGKYNQLLAELNILTQTKPEIVSELEYFTDDEKKSATERLGKFQSEFLLTNEKSTLVRIINTSYTPNDVSTIKTLSQLGIGSKTGTGSLTISSSQMRGYLEIDEKKLDLALKENINDIKDLFGFDSNDDMVIDNGIAYQLDKNLQSYVQIGGIVANKNRTIDSQIQTSETQIKKLESQIATKETDLKRKYGQMEATLNNLESQKTTITNFNKQYEK